MLSVRNVSKFVYKVECFEKVIVIDSRKVRT